MEILAGSLATLSKNSVSWIQVCYPLPGLEDVNFSDKISRDLSFRKGGISATPSLLIF